MNGRFAEDFPALRKSPLAYLDNAATTQVPDCVTTTLYRNALNELRGNPGRGLHPASEDAQEDLAYARKTITGFIGAEHPEEIIFTRNTTDGLNMAAEMLAGSGMLDKPTILVSKAAHHSNYLPWLDVARRYRMDVEPMAITPEGQIDVDLYEARLSRMDVAIVAVEYVGNVFGFEQDIYWLAQKAHQYGAVIVVDAAQAAGHLPIDVRRMGCDMLAFSGHKMYGPSGIGVLYGRKELLHNLPPVRFGGGMVLDIQPYSIDYRDAPERFEAGTVDVASAVGLAEAAKYLRAVGFPAIERLESELTERMMRWMLEIKGVRILGSKIPEWRKSIVSFTVDGVHPHDAAQLLASDNICVRAGHLCAIPLLRHLGVGSVVRASVAFYNGADDVDRFLESLSTVRQRMGVA